MNRTLLRLLFAIPLASMALYACGDDSTEPPEEEEGPAGYEDVVYDGAVTDESLVALASALDQGEPGGGLDAPMVTEPSAGELPRDTIPTFRWVHGASPGARAPAEPRLRGAPELVPDLRDRAPAWIAPLRELLGPERAASAHGTPYTGYATFLTFATASDAKLVRVFTSASEYTPAQEAWDKLAGAGAPITLTLIGAEFAENRIAEAGGPYKGPAFTFTVAAP